jgi:hypothetical protein
VCSCSVRTKDQLKGARVDILIDGVPDPVGGGIADWPDQWFGLNPGVTLHPGQVVRARQSLGGDVSPPPPPSVGATVQDRSVAVPQFIAPLVACSHIAVVGGLVPEATVTVSDANGTVLGTAAAAGSSVVVPLSRMVVSEVLTATSAACGATSSPTVQSLKSEPMQRTATGNLLAPLLSGNVFPCMRILHFTNTEVGGDAALDEGAAAYEKRYQETRIRGLTARAKELGYQLTPSA